MRKYAVAVLLVIALTNLGVWGYLNRPVDGVAWTGMINGASFDPSQRDSDPLNGKFATIDDMDRDLALLEGKVRTVRTYTALDGLEYVPELAAKYGIGVLAGAWVDARLGKNEAEINTLIKMVRRNSNIPRVIVGNESVLRGEVTVQQLTRYIRRVKEKVRVPVSTAEPWHVWLKYPELAREGVYIAVHILPYWEGVPAEESLPYLLSRFAELKRAYPDKNIVVTEVGWPSAGKTRQGAVPSLTNQAMFLREFLNTAQKNGIDYNVIEAFDQPWKRQIEHSVGAHWGLFDADRAPKFSWTGSVVDVAAWPLMAGAATLLALLPLCLFFWRWDHLQTRGMLFFGSIVQFAASYSMWALAVPVIQDYAPPKAWMFGLLMPSLALLVLVSIINALEVTELAFVRKWRRRHLPFTTDSCKTFPKVSIHLACCNEPPEMVKLTIDSLVNVDYPNLEVLVVDNNTKDEKLWRPVEQYVDSLRERMGDRVKFFHLPKWPGYKAGALNFAMSQTAPDAEVIGLVDADYMVRKDWLKSLIPYFENPKVAWVQAPQDHREWESDIFKKWINWEYAGFFDIGMVARNEANAIIQHGTMTLMRRKAMDEVGGWGEWCICEDAELGLRFLEAGYESVYVQERFGHGLTPDTFLGYKKQRFRWTFGGMQILKGHWRQLLPWSNSGLTMAQKYHFVAGWLPWIADGFFLIFVMFSLLWSAGLVLWPMAMKAVPLEYLPYVKLVEFDFPLTMFAVPTIAIFVAKLVHHLFMYSTRVNCTWGQRLGSAVVGMSLTYSIALAILQSSYKKSTPFFRTPKCEDKAAFTKGISMARDELLLMLCQWFAAAAVVLWTNPESAFYARIWAIVLVIQSTPFAAALVTSMLSAMPSQALRTAPALAAQVQPAE